MKLARVKQCAKCPWRKDVDPHDIPNGYDIEKHKGLSITIADRENPLAGFCSSLSIMTCHETDNAHCVGWLYNQLGVGKNIGLRMSMGMNKCENIGEIEVVGEQHENFNDTLPDSETDYL